MFYILVFILGLLIGTIFGFICLKTYIKKHTELIINENMIKNLLMAVGRTPSQKQINEIMKKIKWR